MILPTSGRREEKPVNHPISVSVFLIYGFDTLVQNHKSCVLQITYLAHVNSKGETENTDDLELGVIAVYHCSLDKFKTGSTFCPCLGKGAGERRNRICHV